MKYWALLLVLSGLATAQVPKSKHIWMITEENHSFEEVMVTQACLTTIRLRPGMGLQLNIIPINTILLAL
jgi:hypothetical protein